MTIYTINKTPEVYTTERDAFIKAREGFKPKPYFDTVNKITIGWGFNIMVPGYLQEICGVLKLDTSKTGPEAQYYSEIVRLITTAWEGKTESELQRRLDAQMALRAADETIQKENKPTTFSVSEDDIKLIAMFTRIVGQKEEVLSSYLGSNLVGRYSAERIALVSLAYNDSPSSPNPLLGGGLKGALTRGDRAAAWYEIRYNSNGGASRSKGIANRRVAESNLFGFFSQTTDADQKDKEWRDAYIMYHTPACKTKITSEEAAWPETFGYSQKIEQQIEPARSGLSIKYGRSQRFLWDHVFVNKHEGGALTAVLRAGHTADLGALIIGAKNSPNTLTGTAKKDTIVGGNVLDTLDSGSGYATMTAGSAITTMISHAGGARMEGGAGVTVMRADGGEVQMVAGTGRCFMYGGTGRNSFEARQNGNGCDIHGGSGYNYYYVPDAAGRIDLYATDVLADNVFNAPFLSRSTYSRTRFADGRLVFFDVQGMHRTIIQSGDVRRQDNLPISLSGGTGAYSQETLTEADYGDNGALFCEHPATIRLNPFQDGSKNIFGAFVTLEIPDVTDVEVIQAGNARRNVWTVRACPPNDTFKHGHQYANVYSEFPDVCPVAVIVP